VGSFRRHDHATNAFLLPHNGAPASRRRSAECVSLPIRRETATATAAEENERVGRKKARGLEKVTKAVQKWAAFLFAKRVNATMVFGYIEGRGRRRADRKSGNASLPQTERA
jgi:hypothetical protein